MSNVLRAVLLLALLFALSKVALAHDHGPGIWIRDGKYRGEDGLHCCNEHDCKPVDPESIRTSPRGYHLPTGEVIPFAKTKPSEDKHYWRCKRWDNSTRCFFAPIGGV